MKKLLNMFLTLALVLTPLTVALPAQAVSPTWDVTGSYTVNFDSYVHDMSLVQDGSGNLTGNGGYPASGPYTYAWALTSGAVVGNAINLTVDYNVGAVGTTMHMTGTIAGDGTMSGTWDDNYGGSTRTGTWVTATGKANHVVTSSTVVVSGNTSLGENLPGWLFNRDASTSTPYEFNTTTSSIGTGALYVKPIGANASDKFIGENFINSPIADVNSISYDFKIGSGGDATDANQFYMSVYANFGVSDDLKFYDCRYNVVPTVGSTGGFTTVTFDPTLAYPVTTRGGASASPYTCPEIPAQMNNLSAGSNIRVFALNVGDTSTSDIGLDGYIDKVVVNTDTNVTTYDFDPTPVVPTYTLTTVLAGTGSGSVSSTPAGINCGADCSEAYASGTNVTLTAVASAGSTFTGYSGACTGTGPCVVTVNAAKSVTATFTLDPIVVSTPTDKNQCKADGWKSFTSPTFKNQGQCVSFVAAKK